MLKHELSVQIALELIFGRTSKFYESVYDDGLIDETYAFDFTLKRLWICYDWLRFYRPGCIRKSY